MYSGNYVAVYVAHYHCSVLAVSSVRYEFIVAMSLTLYFMHLFLYGTAICVVWGSAQF
jgi:hypothetical protein